MGSVTTGYINEFPASIPRITEIIQHTCSHLSIMADLPGYGLYSDPDAFDSYRLAIETLRHRTVQKNLDDGYCVGKSFDSSGELTKVRPGVRLIMFSPEEQQTLLRRQLTRDGLMKALADPKDSTTRTKLTNFVTANSGLLHEKAEEFIKRVHAGTGYEEFIQLMLTAQRDAEKDFKKAGIEIRYAPQSSIMRMWIQDAEEAAFSFDHSSETEIAFKTRDAKLLQNFSQIFEQHWKSAIAYDDYWNAKQAK